MYKLFNSDKLQNNSKIQERINQQNNVKQNLCDNMSKIRLFFKFN